MCIICVIHYQTTCVTISDVHIDPQYTHTETVYLHFTYTTYPNCLIKSLIGEINCLTPTSQV